MCIGRRYSAASSLLFPLLSKDDAARRHEARPADNHIIAEPMDVVESQARPDTAEFRDNAARMTALVADLRARLERGAGRRRAAAHARHREQGKLLVRERIDALLDPGSPFLELVAARRRATCTTATRPAPGSSPASAACPGREVLIVANDATVKGGTYYPLTVKKHLRAQEIALENRLPCVYLVDSGGAFLPLQAEVFPDREHFGRIFYNQARMSAARHPADRRGDGLVHGRRRLRAGDVRRDDHRQGHRARSSSAARRW